MINKLNLINELIVLFNQKEVGRLQIKDKVVYFQYHKEWLNSGFSISPFKLPLNNQIFKFEQKYGQPPIWGVFVDCLPDGWGIRLNIVKCAKFGINYERLNILQQLSLINKTGLGGLDFIPQNKLDEDIKTNLEQISNDVMKNYHNISSLELIDEIYNLAASSGGARPKIHFKKNDDNSNWIIKFPTSKEDKNCGRSEYNANIMAQKCGIKINDCNLVKLNNGIELFWSKRFDIINDVKKHTISIAGLLDMDFKKDQIDYYLIFEIIDRISVNKNEDMYEFFARMVFNYKLPNCDDHAKNTCFIYNEKLNGYELSPCYDITKTADLKYHQLLCNGKENPTNDDFIQIAKGFRLNITRCNQIIDLVEKQIRNE